MADPYRDKDRPCPACNAPLRTFRTRLVCDACQGMFAPIDDLATAIEDLTGVPPVFTFEGEATGKRACPECAHPMTTFHLHVALDGEVVKPRPELDRCATHGIWFDAEELAVVFEKARAKHPGGGGVRPGRGGGGGGGAANAGWSGDRKGPFWWGGGHGTF
jgi:hypothetical protein